MGPSVPWFFEWNFEYKYCYFNLFPKNPVWVNLQEYLKFHVALPKILQDFGGKSYVKNKYFATKSSTNLSTSYIHIKPFRVAFPNTGCFIQKVMKVLKRE